jgi:glutamine amidotransferase
MIGIIDYGLGNIKAFQNIYHKLHIPAKVLRKADDFNDVQKLILPGVGAFDHAIRAFNASGMRDTTERMVLQERIPVLGICVGMQMLANSSEEGNLPGLGWIRGKVRKFDVNRIHHATHLPHMGWNNISIVDSSSILQNYDGAPRFYFLHSYYFECSFHEDSVATSNYGMEFSAAVQHENILGVQFHPEKSHYAGIQLLSNFSKL